MKKATFLWVIMIMIPIFMQGQNNKTKRGYIKFGTGLYLDISRLSDHKTYKDTYSGLSPQAVVPGKTIWIEGGYRLNNGLILSASGMWELTRRKRIDVIYHDQKALFFQENYSANVGYEINLGKRNFFTPSLGLLYNRLTTSTADYDISINSDHSLSFSNPHIFNRVDEEVGLNISLDYYYLFKNNLFLGIRANTIYLISIGMEGLTFTPVLGVKF